MDLRNRRKQPLNFVGDDDGVESFWDPTRPAEKGRMSYARPARLSGFTSSSSTCRAMAVVVLTVLLFCAFLSHYYTAIHPQQPQGEPQSFAMTISEQQNLLKAYLGESSTESSFGFHLKLPAGGNPIDLIRLLHSFAVAEDEEDP